MLNAAVFLDRDGVLNELVYYNDMGMVDSPFTVEQFKLLPNVEEAIGIFNHLNLKTVVVSNQPGIARGHFDQRTLAETDLVMKKQLAVSSAFLDAIYYCPHCPNGKIGRYNMICDCRKPKPGLLLKAAKDLNIDLAESYMIGDELTDIQAGKSAGCKSILLGRMKCQLCRIMDDKGIFPDFIVADLLQAAKLIERRLRHDTRAAASSKRLPVKRLPVILIGTNLCSISKTLSSKKSRKVSNLDSACLAKRRTS
jgi:D-glycero-D-manno-heptose 1,7-bisphosphate phosphatase